MALFKNKPRPRPQRNPEALAQFKLGRSLSASGRVEQAAACYRAALALDPDFAEAVVNLGILYGQLGPGHADEQLACLRRGAELNPDSSRAHYNLGVALARRQRTSDEAVAEFERALELDPSHRNALYALSQQWSRRGERARAEHYHRRYRAAMGQAEPALLPTLTAFHPAPSEPGTEPPEGSAPVALEPAPSRPEVPAALARDLVVAADSAPAATVASSAPLPTVAEPAPPPAHSPRGLALRLRFVR